MYIFACCARAHNQLASQVLSDSDMAFSISPFKFHFSCFMLCALRGWISPFNPTKLTQVAATVFKREAGGFPFKHRLEGFLTPVVNRGVRRGPPPWLYSLSSSWKWLSSSWMCKAFFRSYPATSLEQAC